MSVSFLCYLILLFLFPGNKLSEGEGVIFSPGCTCDGFIVTMKLRDCSDDIIDNRANQRRLRVIPNC